MQQVIVDFGVWGVPLRVYGYGLMLVLGFLLGIYLAQWRARRSGEDPEYVAHCGILALVGGILGARFAYVVEKSKEFAGAESRLGAVLNITSGGLIYYGGVLLATILVVAYLRFRRLPVRRYLDIVTVSLMVGLAFGRAGCILNGCCYGARCSDGWPLGMRFPMFSKPLYKLGGGGGYSEATDGPSPVYGHQLAAEEIVPDPRLTDKAGRLIPPRRFTPEQIAVAESQWSHPVKPAQVLGLLNALLLAGLLAGFYRLRRREGEVFVLLLILYPITRFVLEGIRGDERSSLLTSALTHNQLWSLAISALGVIMWVALRKLPASAGPPVVERLAGRRPGRRSQR